MNMRCLFLNIEVQWNKKFFQASIHLPNLILTLHQRQIAAKKMTVMESGVKEGRTSSIDYLKKLKIINSR